MDMFSARDRQRLRDKVRDVAANIPESLNLKTVSRLRGAQLAPGVQGAYELRIGSGYRVGFLLLPESSTLKVYLAGTHDYANKNFLSALERRVGP